MANQARVVIKINHKDEDRIQTKINQQEIIMEWDVKRILVAVGVLVFIILLPIYIFSVDSYQPVSEKPINTIQDITKPVVEHPDSFVNNNPVVEDVKSIEDRIKEGEQINKTGRTENLSKYTEDNKEITPSPEIDNHNSLSNENINIAPAINKDVIQDINAKTTVVEKQTVNDSSSHSKVLDNTAIRRALLANGIKDKEPIGKVVSPVVVSMDKKIKLFYFTEIMNMEGKSLYHEWLWKGQSLFKREIKISGERWRASTNKLIPYSKPGLWTVKLINNDGDTLNEIKFEVVNK